VRKKNKKDKHEKFMEFWNSPTTKNLVTLSLPMVGYIVLVPIAYKIEQHLKDEHGNPQISGFGGNFTTLYSAVAIAKMIGETGKALGVGPALKAAVTPVPLGYP